MENIIKRQIQNNNLNKPNNFKKNSKFLLNNKINNNNIKKNVKYRKKIITTEYFYFKNKKIFYF